MRLAAGLVFLVLMGLMPPTAAASGGWINLAWDSCGNQGLLNTDFACDGNQGQATFVVSFVPPVNIPPVDFVGIDATIIVEAAQPGPVPDWWRLDAGGCRPTSGTLAVARNGDVLCADVGWNPQYSAWGYLLNWDKPNSGSIVVNVSVGPPGIPPLTQGVEYFGFRFTVDHAKSAGADSCAGCSEKTILTLYQVVYHTTTEAIVLDTPLRQNVVTWQAGLVPTRNTTWGHIKGLYR